MWQTEDTTRKPKWLEEDVMDFSEDVSNALKALSLLLDYADDFVCEPTFPFHRGLAKLLWALAESVKSDAKKIIS